MHLRKMSADILASFWGECLLFVFAFILGVLTARFLGADGKGKFGVIYIAAGLLSVIFSARFHLSITYHLSKNKDRLGEIILYAILMGVLSISCIAVVTIFFHNFLDKTLLKGVNIRWSVLVLLCASIYLWDLLNALLAGLFLFKVRAIFMGGSYLLKSLVVLLALGFLTLELEGLFLLLGSVETIIYSLAVLAILFSAKSFRFSLSYLLRMLRYSFQSFPGMVSDLVTLRIDVFFINYFSGPSQVGIYTVAVSMANMLLYIPTAVRSVLMPYVARHMDREITSKLSRLLILVMGLLSVVIIPLVWVMITPVYGQEFTSSRVLFLFLLPGVMFWGVFILLASDVEGRGLPWRISAVSMISALVLIGLDLVLIPRFNSVGAAIASSITHGISMILAVRLYYRITGINPVHVFVPKPEDIQLIFKYVNNLIISLKRTLAKSSTG